MLIDPKMVDLENIKKVVNGICSLESMPNISNLTINSNLDILSSMHAQIKGDLYNVSEILTNKKLLIFNIGYQNNRNTAKLGLTLNNPILYGIAIYHNALSIFLLLTLDSEVECSINMRKFKHTLYFNMALFYNEYRYNREYAIYKYYELRDDV